MRMNLVRILPGDAVIVEVSRFDRNLGRITHLGKGSQHEQNHEGQKQR